jgi:hypothetical protein
MALAAKYIALSVDQRLVGTSMGPVAKETLSLFHGLMRTALFHVLGPVVATIAQIFLAQRGQIFVIRLVRLMTGSTHTHRHWRMHNRGIEPRLVMAVETQIRLFRQEKF